MQPAGGENPGLMGSGPFFFGVADVVEGGAAEDALGEGDEFVVALHDGVDFDAVESAVGPR